MEYNCSPNAENGFRFIDDIVCPNNRDSIYDINSPYFRTKMPINPFGPSPMTHGKSVEKIIFVSPPKYGMLVENENL